MTKEIIPHSVDKQMLLKGKACEITYPKAYKMKYERCRSITCHSEMAIVLKSLVKNPYIEKNDQEYPNEMIFCRGGRF